MSKEEQLLEFANKLADVSAKVIKGYYRAFGAINSKADLSPVTIADMEAEKEIRQLIKKTYPNHGIRGEELGIENEKSPYLWVIDPIDGTASFMIGRPIFGTLISLLKNGEVVIGIINQPITDERWVGAHNKVTLFNNKPVKVRNCNSLKEAILCTTGPQYFANGKLDRFNKIAKEVKHVVYGGDCYNYGLLALGLVDVVIESGLKAHDFLALKVIVEGAGGIVSDWQGNPLNQHSCGDVLFCSSKQLQAELLEYLL